MVNLKVDQRVAACRRDPASDSGSGMGTHCRTLAVRIFLVIMTMMAAHGRARSRAAPPATDSHSGTPKLTAASLSH